ncbi:MAG: hypothetical protein JW953_21315 [Anaerolineae bacterium]|nr:hypothetical protein [Anaerolineae bacterium]
MTNPNLFSCPDCGHDCSFAALSCPNCGKPFPREASNKDAMLSDAVHTNILRLTTSTVGMCLTFLGLIKIVEGVQEVSHITDELLAVVALGFLASGLFSYFALKETQPGRKQRLSITVHRIFIASFLGLIIICIVVVFEAV